MNVSHQIDKLIQSLNALKPLLSDDKDLNSKKFNDVLKNTLEDSSNFINKSIEATNSSSEKTVDIVPDWVDADYGYNIENPRKPSMREFMEAISGERVETLYKKPREHWRNISFQASELLYGVIGSNEDTRNWSFIMAAGDVLAAAKAETAKIYEPKIFIESHYNEVGDLVDQSAVLKDKNEQTLRSIPNNVSLAEETLSNFGASHASIPKDLEQQVDDLKFDKDLLNFLKDFRMSASSVEKIALQTATEALSQKISEEIPFEELAKL